MTIAHSHYFDAGCSNHDSECAFSMLLTTLQVGDSSEQKIAALKPKRVQQRGQNQVPSIFKLEPSPEEQRLNGMKKQLVTALQPTPETVEAISKDDTLASGSCTASSSPNRPTINRSDLLSSLPILYFTSICHGS